MYVHLGGDVIVDRKEVIAIFDFDNTTISSITRQFLKTAEAEDFIETVSMDIPRSFVVCEHKGRSKVYITPISPQTLAKRTAL